jgi:hypothetical protein
MPQLLRHLVDPRNKQKSENQFFRSKVTKRSHDQPGENAKGSRVGPILMIRL